MPVLNLQYLNEICDGDVEMRNELIDIFIAQASELPETLASHLASDDLPSLAADAHKMRSTALSMGLEQMADALKKIEVICKKMVARDGMGDASEAVKSLYVSQINGLTPELDRWTEQNLSKKSLSLLVDFCKSQSNLAKAEALELRR